MRLNKIVIAQLLIFIIFVHALQTHASNTKSEEKIQIRWYTQVSDHEDNDIRIEKEAFVERFKTSFPYSISVFDLLQKTCMNDKIIFITYNHEISTRKIEKLIIQDCSLCTFLGQKGNFLPTIGFYYKWSNRFNIQILKINPEQDLYNLFRVSSDKL